MEWQDRREGDSNMSDVGKFIGGFGESFVKTLQTERERAQRQQQFNQEMAFKTRQMNLMNSIYQQRQDLDVKQFEYKRDQPFETKSGDIYPTQGGQPNFNMPPLWQMPVAPEKKPEPKPSLLRSGWEGGFFSDYFGFKDEGGKEIITSIQRRNPATQTGSGGGKDKPYDEGKLSEAGAKALGFFTQPNPSSGFLGIIGGDSKKEIKAKIADNIATLSKDIMKSDTYKYIQNLFNTMGYIDPETLQLNAINDANKGIITEQQANEIATFLNYYDTMYDGIQELEEFIK